MLSQAGHEFVPYAEHFRMYSRAGVPRMRIRNALTRYWRPFLHGETGRQEAIELIASELAGEQGSATRVEMSDYFELHSDPWINLHHFLYQWARADEGLGTGRQLVTVPERSSLNQLAAAERAEWSEAVAFYRNSVAARRHFDDDLLELKQELLALDGDTGVALPDTIEGIQAALTVAMPIYLTHWWPEHDGANRRWSASVMQPLRRHEARYVEITTRLYGSRWPQARRIDVSAYANARAGYTAIGHTVMFSTDPGNQGLYAFEMLLHEVQHTRDVAPTARQELAHAFEAVAVEQPGNLWHALIFATAGAFAQWVALDEALPAHTPYWIREGFEDLQGGASSYRPCSSTGCRPCAVNRRHPKRSPHSLSGSRVTETVNES